MSNEDNDKQANLDSFITGSPIAHRPPLSSVKPQTETLRFNKLSAVKPERGPTPQKPEIEEQMEKDAPGALAILQKRLADQAADMLKAEMFVKNVIEAAAKRETELVREIHAKDKALRCTIGFAALIILVLACIIWNMMVP